MTQQQNIDRCQHLPCVFCELELPTPQFIVHLKQQHNYAITRLVQFHDPRYYLTLLKHKGPDYLAQHASPRPSDSVMTLRHDNDDMELRKIAFAFQRARALEQLQFESSYKVSRVCFVCQSMLSKMTYQQILEHYTERHHLRVGFRPGVVYINRMLRELEVAYAAHTCQYCKQVFANMACLKNHYRTHQHFRFAAKDNQFDCFFIDQYRDLDQNNPRASLGEEPDDPDDEDPMVDQDDRALSDVDRDLMEAMRAVPYLDQIVFENNVIQCLFCAQKFDELDYKEHLENVHAFQFDYQIWGDFYQCVRQINYVRSKIQTKNCPFCGLYVEEDGLHIREHCGQQLPAVEEDVYYISPQGDDPVFGLIPETACEPQVQIIDEDAE